jgi:1,5-anhydro-D-fructose reductase (1,5-anhydro-D-mannitol-forming)
MNQRAPGFDTLVWIGKSARISRLRAAFPSSGSAAARYPSAGMDKINWIVAGIGDIARKRVIPAIEAEPRSTLYGFVTRDSAKAAAWPGARTWPSIDEAVADPAVDAVYIALPVAMHAQAAIKALGAGKHVLCEKPMAFNVAQSMEMAAAAKASGRLLGVPYYRRLYPKLLRARDLVAEGVIGQPLLVEANCHGFTETLPGRDWLVDPALAGGGPLYDTGSHRIDAMCFLFGRPVRASGILSNAVHRMKVEDSATAVIGFENGVHGVVDVRWNSHIARDQFRIVGVDGEIVLDPLNGPELRVNLRAGSRAESFPPHANLHYPAVSNFVDALLANSPALLACPADQGVWTDWVIERVVQSQLP